MQVEKTPMVHVKLKMKIPPSQLMSGNVPLPSNWLDFLQIQYKHTHNSTTTIAKLNLYVYLVKTVNSSISPYQLG